MLDSVGDRTKVKQDDVVVGRTDGWRRRGECGWRRCAGEKRHNRKAAQNPAQTSIELMRQKGGQISVPAGTDGEV